MCVASVAVDLCLSQRLSTFELTLQVGAVVCAVGGAVVCAVEAHARWPLVGGIV